MPTLEGQLPATLPVNDDGELYSFAMTVDQTTVLSDSLADLVSAIIPGYEEARSASAEDAYDLRVNAAVQRANTAQALVALASRADGSFEAQDESEDTLTAIMSSREEPLDGVTVWEHEVPLILVATNYAPYSATPLPTGNVVTINPYTERTLLDSLNELGDIEFFVS